MPNQDSDGRKPAQAESTRRSRHKNQSQSAEPPSPSAGAGRNSAGDPLRRVTYAFLTAGIPPITDQAVEFRRKPAAATGESPRRGGRGRNRAPERRSEIQVPCFPNHP